MVLILLLFFVGILLGNSSKNAHGELSNALATFAITVSLPALILHHLHTAPLSLDMAMPALAPFLLFFIVLAPVLILWRMGKITRPTAGCLALVCGTGNTSIVGVPLIQTYYGEEALKFGIVFDQANFLVMSVLGLVAASFFSAQHATKSEIVKTVLTYPPILAATVALIARPIDFPMWLTEILVNVGATLTPVAIVSVGATLKIKEMTTNWSIVTFGLLGKLVLVPFLLVCLLFPFSNLTDPMAYQVSILQAGMPPMIIAGLVAIEKKLDPPLAIALISFGIPISFATLFAIARLV